MVGIDKPSRDGPTMHSKEHPQYNPDPSKCSFYVPSKRRFCKANSLGEGKYCPMHVEEHNGRKRVPCPLNPNHSVYEDEISRHVKICPDARFDPTGHSYYSLNLNYAQARVEESSESTADAHPRGHHALSDSELNTHFLRVKDLYERFVLSQLSESGLCWDQPDLPQDDEQHGVTEETEVPKATEDQKHTPQHLGLFYEISQLGFLPQVFRLRKQTEPNGQSPAQSSSPAEGANAPPPLYSLAAEIPPSSIGKPLGAIVELGAGKAGLAFALRHFAAQCAPLQDAVGRIPTVVADRGTFRHKKDGRVANDNPFIRLRLDIKDLKLDGVAELQPTPISGSEPTTPRSILVFGKHLCGACTDFALGACFNSSLSVDCICIATCCHHLCDPLLLRDWAAQLKGTDEAASLLPTTSTSVSRKRSRSPDSAATPSGFGDALLNALPTLKEWEALVTMTSWAVCGNVPSHKADLGRFCKRIIDELRVQYMLNVKGFRSGRLVHYVPETVTKENAAILICR
jgi:tRNA:m4X modification enzyme